jgi:hypothetical protein
MSNNEIPVAARIRGTSGLVVLFICYARINQVIESISSLANEGITEFYVSIDAPRNERITKIQSALIEALELQTEKLNVKIHVQKSDHNLGVSKAVQFGVDWVFRNAESAIILEDDLKVSPSLASYFSVALRKLDDFDKVLIASANQFNQLNKKTLNCTWTTYPLIWGWATTRSKWKEIKYLINCMDVNRKGEKSYAVRGFWLSGRLRVRAQVLDSWALPLADAFHHGSYLAICPPRNLCMNVGNDEFGMHTSTATRWMSTPAYGLAEGWEIPDLDFNRVQEYDRFLEKEFFGIRIWHTFSPVKAELQILFKRYVKRKGRK